MSHPPPPPPPQIFPISNTLHPPILSSPADPHSYLLELLIYNGSPFADHWAYFIRSHHHPDLGVEIHATGDVRSGFVFQIKRAFDLRGDENAPTKRVPLQWVEGRYFHPDGEDKMLNWGVFILDDRPVCIFEEVLGGVEVPGRTLVSAVDGLSEERAGRKIVQRNCQTWIVESAEQLVKEGLLEDQVAAYLRAIKQ